MAFREAGIEIEWKGKGIKENGINKDTGESLVEVDTKYFRPTEVDYLIGDYSKAKKKLGWEPTHTLEDLVKDMVASDIALFTRDKYLIEGGHKVLNPNE
jgi:GDPmannose 4,6-dehydratase